MLLRELATSNDRKIAKINRVLKETYGFTLNSDVEIPKIVALQEKVAAELHALKMNQVTAKDSRYVKAVLVQEGLGMLVTKLYESSVAPVVGPGAQAFQRVLSWLSDYVRQACEVGDDHDEAVYEAMKQYRSSKYRFDDALVEFELRKATADCSTPTAPQEPDIEMAMGGAGYNDVMGFNDGPEEPMYEADSLAIDVKDMKKPAKKSFEPATNLCPHCEGKKKVASKAAGGEVPCPVCDGAGEVFEAEGDNKYAEWEKRLGKEPGYFNRRKAELAATDGVVGSSSGRLRSRFASRSRGTDVPFVGNLRMGEGVVNEKAPPGMEDWVKSNKAKFKKEYGDEKGEEVLYATAWKMHNKEK